MVDSPANMCFHVRCTTVWARIVAPADVGATVAAFFALAVGTAESPTVTFEILPSRTGGHDMLVDGVVALQGSRLGDILRYVEDALIELDSRIAPAELLRCAAVSWRDKLFLVTGDDDIAVTMTLGWLVDQGFSFRGQRLMRQHQGHVTGFPGPFSTPSNTLKWLFELPALRNNASVRSGDTVMVAPPPEQWPPAAVAPCAGIILASRPAAFSGQRLGVPPDAEVQRVLGQVRLGGENAILTDLPAITVEFDAPRNLKPDFAELLRHIAEDNLDKRAARLELYAEDATLDPANPFNRFELIRYINLDEQSPRHAAVQRNLARLGLSERSIRFAAIRTPDNHHVGCALSHRAIIADARQRGVRNVLVFEDDVMFHRDTLKLLPDVLAELEGVEWDMFYLGGHVWGRQRHPIPGCATLKTPTMITTTHAIAYNHTVFDRLLNELPDDVAGMTAWVAEHLAIDQFFSKMPARKLLAEPMLAMQVELLGQPEVADKGQFVL